LVAFLHGQERREFRDHAGGLPQAGLGGCGGHGCSFAGWCVLWDERLRWVKAGGEEPSPQPQRALTPTPCMFCVSPRPGECRETFLRARGGGGSAESRPGSAAGTSPSTSGSSEIVGERGRSWGGPHKSPNRCLGPSPHWQGRATWGDAHPTD